MRHKVLGVDIYVDGRTGCFALSKRELGSLVAQSFDFEQCNPCFSEYKTTSVTFCLNISDSCNLRCDYCFNYKKSGSGMSVSQANLFLDKCFHSFPDKEKYFVDLSGKGEPLLFLNNILEIKKHCDEWSNRLKREVLVQFVTNGTLLLEDTAQILQNHGILFGVSLDGNEELHDKHRKDAKGKPTYQRVLQNVIAIPHHEYVGVACTLTKDVFSLNDSLNELSKVFNTISYKPVRNCAQAFDEESVNLWLNSYDELVEALIKESVDGNLRRIKILLNGEDYLGKFIHRIVLNQRTLLRCDAGLSRFVLDDGGEIYACPASFGKKDFLLGIDFKIDFEKSEVLFKNQVNPSECANCDFRHFCGGECPLEKSLSGGVNQVMCLYKSHLILLAMYFALTLYEHNKESFFQIRDFCEEVDQRKKLDRKLMSFLEVNPQLTFTEGEKVFDSLEKRY